jgi:hypothetical protein
LIRDATTAELVEKSLEHEISANSAVSPVNPYCVQVAANTLPDSTTN